MCVCFYLGVDPCIGFSIARFIIAAVTSVKSNQSPMNLHHKFFSESNMGIDHIPINVTNYVISTFVEIEPNHS